MSSTHHHVDPTVPKGALWFCASLIGFTLVMASVVRLGFMPVAASPELQRQAEHLKPMVTRDLSFVDRADGGLTITDIRTGKAVKVIAPGEPSGFIRGVMRSMGRERRMHGVGPSAPFRVASWPDGQLSLTDTFTGRMIELNSFGPSNRASFDELMK